MPEKTFQHEAPIISAVIPTYNVARWLPAFLASLAQQDAPAGAVEFIFVDDGATDESASLIEAWASSHPEQATVLIRQENGGAAAARNTGLLRARGPWLTFPDPDDVLHPDYFAQALKFIRLHGEKDVALLSSHLVYLDNDGTELNDQHPLRGKFALGTRIAHLTAEPMIQLSAASAFLRTGRVLEAELRFDERVKPNFEDAHFIARYLLLQPDPKVGLLASAKYHYRRRGDQSSLIQTSYSMREKYDDVIEFGYLDILRVAQERGSLPRWLENTVLYDLFWYFKNERAMHSPSAGAPTDAFPRFHQLVGEMLSRLSKDSIKSFDVMGVEFAVRFALLTGYEKADYRPVEARLMEVDERAQLSHLTYWFTGDAPETRIVVNGEDVSPTYATTETLTFYGRELLKRRHLWVPNGHRIEIYVEGRGLLASNRELRLVSESFSRAQLDPAITGQRRSVYRRFTQDSQRPGQWIAADVRNELRQLRSRFSKTSLVERKMSAQLRSKRIRSRFTDAWVFMDKIHAANDNAEHLYRYVRDNHPSVNAWFVLHPKSADWNRLEAEGFRLVAHGSRDWELLMMCAVHYASSHADQPVVQPLPTRRFGRQRYHFTFLQHGVINYDLSRWLNNKPFRLFVTTTVDEQESIAGDGPYTFTDREVVLTGMPRHDKLIHKREFTATTERNLVVVMPTWRHYLLGAVDPLTGMRSRSESFASSDYAREYSALLSSEEFVAAARDQGCDVVFMPHPNMKPYLADFTIHPDVRVTDFETENIQDVLAHARAVVTDYSSLGFEAALLDIPLVYLHFDIDRFFGGSHIGRRGYFDYHRDGFGPVTTTASETVRELLRLAGGSFTQPDQYALRTESAFPFRDGNSSERVFRAMQALISSGGS
ncbi:MULTISPECIES: CDP-glycerol glycerophosphotransferase family protein [unclassified Curtobacterium]|uniref:bifunctional glycosyltransferase/CDP-glycerol:glycerophosphate glycerophosphotransferase n=1 Tax=unclassified Curtobacterium TaxID=257496 RepID=UPI00104A4CD8|nr:MULTISPECIES: CDP-glycerol glycerophosphotransferase family protein [unclassified Curtobacterium]TCL81331.1 CDP-glycerol glycerophosphotransferase (TagB/SpsB family) [Curtobacterium sp. PhB128]TCL99456.1 CDP-glycerol glycerophosphotransferase (TagB/SpsB family) [Curtobacterium sp. PhB138]